MIRRDGGIAEQEISMICSAEPICYGVVHCNVDIIPFPAQFNAVPHVVNLGACNRLRFYSEFGKKSIVKKRICHAYAFPFFQHAVRIRRNQAVIVFIVYADIIVKKQRSLYIAQTGRYICGDTVDLGIEIYFRCRKFGAAHGVLRHKSSHL